MPLQPGTTLGPYSVTAKIGEGGMGEVYRARDTKLDRDVALKVLPQAFTDDPDRLARFEREAKVLASLNHPNIGHIYGLEEAEPRAEQFTNVTPQSGTDATGTAALPPAGAEARLGLLANVVSERRELRVGERLVWRHAAVHANPVADHAGKRIG